MYIACILLWAIISGNAFNHRFFDDGNEYTILFMKPSHNSTALVPEWVDVHKRINNGQHQNYRMLSTDSGFVYKNFAAPGESLYYSFTYSLQNEDPINTAWFHSNMRNPPSHQFMSELPSRFRGGIGNGDNDGSGESLHVIDDSTGVLITEEKRRKEKKGNKEKKEERSYELSFDSLFGKEPAAVIVEYTISSADCNVSGRINNNDTGSKYSDSGCNSSTQLSHLVELCKQCTGDDDNNLNCGKWVLPKYIELYKDEMILSIRFHWGTNESEVTKSDSTLLMAPHSQLWPVRERGRLTGFIGAIGRKQKIGSVFSNKSNISTLALEEVQLLEDWQSSGMIKHRINYMLFEDGKSGYQIQVSSSNDPAHPAILSVDLHYINAASKSESFKQSNHRMAIQAESCFCPNDNWSYQLLQLDWDDILYYSFTIADEKSIWETEWFNFSLRGAVPNIFQNISVANDIDSEPANDERCTSTSKLGSCSLQSACTPCVNVENFEDDIGRCYSCQLLQQCEDNLSCNRKQSCYLCLLLHRFDRPRQCHMLPPVAADEQLSTIDLPVDLPLICTPVIDETHHEPVFLPQAQQQQQQQQQQRNHYAKQLLQQQHYQQQQLLLLQLLQQKKQQQNILPAITAVNHQQQALFLPQQQQREKILVLPRSTLQPREERQNQLSANQIVQEQLVQLLMTNDALSHNFQKRANQIEMQTQLETLLKNNDINRNVQTTLSLPRSARATTKLFPPLHPHFLPLHRVGIIDNVVNDVVDAVVDEAVIMVLGNV